MNIKTLQRLKPIVELPFLPVWLAPLILFSPLVFTGRPLFWGAVFLQFTPWRVAAFNQVLAGHLPLWNSLSGLGTPLAANYQSALFYPPTWLLLPFYRLGGAGALAMGETWLVVFHLIWSAIGMIFLLRNLGCGKFAQSLGALAFSLSGYLVTRAGFLSINSTVAWLPWVIMASERLTGDKKPGIKYVLGSSLIIAMLLLAGHAQTAFYTLLLAGSWVVYRQSQNGWKSTGRVVLFWSLSVLLGCGLAAIQLIPTAEFLFQSQRASEIGYTYAANYSFLPWRFITLLLPNLFGTPANGSYLLKADAYWEDAIYIGLLPLCLAVAAFSLGLKKQQKNDTSNTGGLMIFLAVSAIIASIIALGRYTPLFPLLYKYIPTFDLFQAPARWMIWLVFALSLMAGFGADAWRKPGKRGRFWLNLTLALGITVTFIALLAGLLMPSIPSVFIRAFLIFGISIMLGCILAKTNPLPTETKGKWVTTWQWAVILFVSVDLLVANWSFHQGADPSLYEKATAAAKSVKAQAGDGRVYIAADDLQQLQYEEFFNFRDFRMDGKWDALANALLPNTNLYGGLASLNNFDPLIPVRYSWFMSVLNNVDESTRLNLLRRMGVTLIEVPVGREGKVRFEPLTGSSRIRWSDCIIFVTNEEDALTEYRKQAAEGAQLSPVVVGWLNGIEGKCTQAGYGITISQEESGKIEGYVNASSKGWLVITDMYYPDRLVSVDNSDSIAYRDQADYLLRIIFLPPGVHTVSLFYQPLSFYAGFAITMLCMILILGLWISEFRGKGKTIPSSSA